MKRDMDLIRKILLTVEAEDEDGQEGAEVINSILSETSPHIVERHISMLEEEELIEKVFSVFSFGVLDKHSGEASLQSYGKDTWRLTWAGHDFLDTIRDDDVWIKTKNAVEKVGGTAAMETWKAVARKFVSVSIEAML